MITRHAGHDRPATMDEGTTAARAPAPSVNTLALVTWRELVTRGLSAGYLVSSAALLAVLVGVIVVPTLLAGPTTYPVGAVGAGSQEILDGAARIANRDAPADERTSFDVTTFDDAAAARRAVTDGAVDAALIGGAQVVVRRAGGWSGNDLLELLQQAAGSREVQQVVPAEDLPTVRAALDGRALEVTPLSGQDAGQTEGRSIIAYGGILLTYLMILQYGVWTLSGVAEEKANRVTEILLSTARPWHLFAGKVLGIAALGLLQFATTLVAALIAVRVTGAFDLPVIPVDFVGTLVVWVLLGFAMYMVVFGAAGALTSRSEDAQSAMAPITVVLMIGFFSSFVVLGNPDGIMGVVGTFVPFWAPFVVPVRSALGVLPLWQSMAAVALSLVTIVGLTVLSARVYRGGSLHIGGRLGWRQALRGADT